MATIEDAIAIATDLTTALTENQATLAAVSTSVGSIVSKLDEIKTFIDTLKAGGSVSQEKLNALVAAINTAKGLATSTNDSLADVKTRTEAALTQADALDE